jgi:hypothetical protein
MKEGITEQFAAIQIVEYLLTVEKFPAHTGSNCSPQSQQNAQSTLT